jgi:hypothetical protein
MKRTARLPTRQVSAIHHIYLQVIGSDRAAFLEFGHVRLRANGRSRNEGLLAIADPAHRQLGDLAWAEDDGKLLELIATPDFNDHNRPVAIVAVVPQQFASPGPERCTSYILRGPTRQISSESLGRKGTRSHSRLRRRRTARRTGGAFSRPRPPMRGERDRASGLETCNAGFVRNASNKKRWQIFESATQVRSEPAGQQLSLEEQERASLGRIMSEMGYQGRHKGRRQAPRNRRSSNARSGAAGETRRPTFLR